MQIYFLMFISIHIILNDFISYIRCKRTSAGPCFLLLMTHKYGHRPTPRHIQEEEFQRLRTILLHQNEKVQLMDYYYTLGQYLYLAYYSK